MDLFPFTEFGTPMLLSASEGGLFLHPVRNERFGHPFLLCSGYKSGFSGCIYNNSLHYAYINKENALLLRRLHESTLLFRLNGTGSVAYRDPRLIVFDNILFLFYFEETPGSYHLKLRLPFVDAEPGLPEPFQTAYSEPPLLFLQATERFLYLFLTTEENTLSYCYSKAGDFELLCSEQELLSVLHLPWESEKKQLEEGLMQAIHLSEQQQNLLTEKEQKLQLMETRFSELSAEADHTSTLLSETAHTLQSTKIKLAECEQNRLRTAQELEHTSLLLDRAKAQYNELMQVAEQYRQEALKWYGKFTDIH